MRTRLLPEHGKTLHDGVEPLRQPRLLRQGNAAEFEVVADIELRKDVAALRDVNNAGIEHLPRREIRDVAPGEGDLTATHRQQAENGLEHGRFAGAIRADYGRDPAGTDARGSPVQDRHLAVAGNDVVECENCVGAHHSVPEISGDDSRIAPHIRRLALGDDAALG